MGLNCKYSTRSRSLHDVSWRKYYSNWSRWLPVCRYLYWRPQYGGARLNPIPGVSRGRQLIHPHPKTHHNDRDTCEWRSLWWSALVGHSVVLLLWLHNHLLLPLLPLHGSAFVGSISSHTRVDRFHRDYRGTMDAKWEGVRIRGVAMPKNRSRGKLMDAMINP